MSKLGKVGLILAFALGVSVAGAFEFYDFNFAAPVVSDESDLTGTGQRAGTIVFDNNESAFKGLSPSGNAVVLGVETGAYALVSKQVFTADGDWDKPEGVTAVVVEVVGGGGAGGGAVLTSTDQASAGAGGGAGGFCRKFITTGLLSTETVTVGEAGDGVSGNVGESGDPSSFGSHCTANGGSGGGVTNAGTGNDTAQPGAGGSSSSGDINVTGSPGSFGFRSGTGGINTVIGGNGGSSFFGGGGTGTVGERASGQVSGGNGGNYGAGGAGSLNGESSSAHAGGDGSDGIVIVWAYADR